MDEEGDLLPPGAMARVRRVQRSREWVYSMPAPE